MFQTSSSTAVFFDHTSMFQTEIGRIRLVWVLQPTVGVDFGQTSIYTMYVFQPERRKKERRRFAGVLQPSVIKLGWILGRSQYTMYVFQTKRKKGDSLYEYSSHVSRSWGGSIIYDVLSLSWCAQGSRSGTQTQRTTWSPSPDRIRIRRSSSWHSPSTNSTPKLAYNPLPNSR